MSRRVLIDGDGCPVVDAALSAAAGHQLECVILCDTSHRIEREGARTIVVSKGADSADFALVNLARPGDLVITQDYGLAAMCLARGARVLHQDGMEYTADNIDSLLLARHTAKKLRGAGKRLKGPAKRAAEQDRTFQEALARILGEP